MNDASTCAVVFSNGERCTRKREYGFHGGICRTCRSWSLRYGGIDPNGRTAGTKHGAKSRTCLIEVDGSPCGKPTIARDLCSAHYQREARHGDPLKTVNRLPGQIIAELEAAAASTSDDCIIFEHGGANAPVVPYEGSFVRASRVVWTIANGDPGSKYVLHACSEGAGSFGCINVRHLYLGDHARNMLDKAKAERCAGTKLTAAKVTEIRRMISAGMTRQSIAGRFGVTPSNISMIASGKTWTWLPHED